MELLEAVGMTDVGSLLANTRGRENPGVVSNTLMCGGLSRVKEEEEEEEEEERRRRGEENE